MFDKQAILEYMLTKNMENSLLLKAYEKQQKENDDLQKIRQKPDMRIYNPMSGKVLKKWDFIPVKFTKIQNSDDTSKKIKYKCPITNKVLTNAVACAVIRKT